MFKAHGAPRDVFAREPVFRHFYLLLFAIHAIFFVVPMSTIKYIRPQNRPVKDWSLRRCLRVRISRQVCGAVAKFELDFLGRDLSRTMVSHGCGCELTLQDPTKLLYSHPLTLSAAPDSWLRGYPATMLQELNRNRGKWEPQFVHRVFRKRRDAFGNWNPQAQAEHDGFVPVEAFWYTGKKRHPTSRPRERRAGQPVALMFHGGGYVCGTAAENDFTSCIAKDVVDNTLIRHVLSVDYRLAPTAPWPLPLLDAISAYHHAVVVEGISEDDLFIGGDSAGGHLAMALTRWIRDEGKQLGLEGPRGLLLFSPWSDIGFTHQYGPEGWHHNRRCDTIHDTFGPFASSLLTRALPPDAIHTDVYLSPASRLIKPAAVGSQSFSGFPPTFVVYGGAERISLEIEELYTRLQLARKAATSHQARHGIHCAPHGIHDFVVFPGFEDEAKESFTRMDEWILSVLMFSSPKISPAKDGGSVGYPARCPPLFQSVCSYGNTVEPLATSRLANLPERRRGRKHTHLTGRQCAHDTDDKGKCVA